MYSLEHFEYILKKYGETEIKRGEFAIMAPFVIKEGKVHLLFEVRAMNMRRQPGEICFPGGRIEKSEEPDQCVVRETGEELGIPANRVKLIGNVGNMRSWLGEDINVFAGEILDYEDIGLNANPDEVHKVFTAPYEFFADKGPQDAFNYEGYYIWGLTARAVNKIVKLCREG
ncbi:MAG: CoA pyrophosphatase [Firmicutes bacterium]|nr:CoA pyrophosphatase [Clostridiales bacterium]MBQ4339522.1 CoA pyrophosphatase [Bacillota bacterium]